MRSKSLVGVVIIMVIMSFTGCILWPVNKKDVIGTYQSVLQDGTPGLPDGGSEILELKTDGTCKQEITLKDGRAFSAKGRWEWDSDKRYTGKKIMLKEIYWAVDEEKITPYLEKTIGHVVPFLSVRRTLTGRVAIGSDEGSHYEKK